MAVIKLPKKLGQDIKKQAKNLGISEEDFVVNAAQYYSELIRKQAELKDELRVWDVASDKDFLQFEKSLS